jgi:RNA polymerase sigma-70 factor (ECF subfamily)
MLGDPGSGRPTMSDEMLAGCARRDGDALPAFLARHCGAVYRIAANLCASPRDAEEVTRHTILSASREAGSRPVDGSLRNWLYGIATRKALRRRRDAADRKPVSGEVFLPHFDADGGHESACREWPELARLEPINVAALLRELLSSMEDDVGAAFVLRDLLELPAEDAAEILETSSENVRRRAHRARLMFRGLLDQLCSI